MTNEPLKESIKVPEPTLRRLPWYLAIVKLIRKRGEHFISSTQIAKEVGLDPSQVAKDLSYVDITGKTRVGYELDVLTRALETFLGFTSQHKAFVFGVGRLGAALMHDTGLSQYGVEIVAGFDVRKDRIGTEIGGIPIFHLNDLSKLMEKHGQAIAILTVPVEQAQEVAQEVVKSGGKAIWNFTPFRIRVPEDIVVQNTSIYAHLAVMFNRIQSNKS